MDKYLYISYMLDDDIKEHDIASMWAYICPNFYTYLLDLVLSKSMPYKYKSLLDENSYSLLVSNAARYHNKYKNYEILVQMILYRLITESDIKVILILAVAFIKYDPNFIREYDFADILAFANSPLIALEELITNDISISIQNNELLVSGVCIKKVLTYFMQNICNETYTLLQNYYHKDHVNRYAASLYLVSTKKMTEGVVQNLHKTILYYKLVNKTYQMDDIFQYSTELNKWWNLALINTENEVVHYYNYFKTLLNLPFEDNMMNYSCQASKTIIRTPLLKFIILCNNNRYIRYIAEIFYLLDIGDMMHRYLRACIKDSSHMLSALLMLYDFVHEHPEINWADIPYLTNYSNPFVNDPVFGKYKSHPAVIMLNDNTLTKNCKYYQSYHMQCNICPICMEYLLMRKYKNCNHYVCNTCAKFISQCPTCRTGY